MVLGKTYKDVYKFYPSSKGIPQIKSIYFAKKFGFIRLERTDGVKLELV